MAHLSSPSFPQISRREWLGAFGVALATAVVGFIPYYLGNLLAQDGVVYMQLIMNPEDAQTYWAKMLQGYRGAWLYTITFTPEPHDAAGVGIFYVWLGQLARGLGISLAAVWHGARIVASLILFLTTFRFVAAFLVNKQSRWTAYLLAIFGSGLGWLLFALGQTYWLDAFPVDFKQPGAHLFFTALTFPHIAVGTAVILFNILALHRIGQTKSPAATRNQSQWRWPILAGVANLLLGAAYPFLIYIIALTAILFWVALVYRQRQILWAEGWQIATMFLIPAPLYLYYLQVWRSNEIFRLWEAQAGTPAAPWPHYLVAFGPMLLLAALNWWRQPQKRGQFIILWLWSIAVALLLYAPLNPQRRFIQGVHVPLALLATAGFVEVVLPAWQQTRLWQKVVALPRYETAKLRRFVIVLFLLFMSLSNIYLWLDVSRIAAITQPDLFFRPTDEQGAVLWLRENEPETAVVLGSYQTGNYVAAHAGQPVVLGHWAETVDFLGKETAVAQFFNADTDDAWRQNFLQRWAIRYVWFGPREKELGTFDPAAVDFLLPVYQNPSITIFAISP